MKDYARILTQIRETPWLITEESLKTILGIVKARIENGKLSDEELAARLEAVGTKGSNANGPQISGGVGILPVYGPIFGKANMMTQMSGATSMEALRNDLAALVDDKKVNSILMDFDSPGGSSEMIAEAADEIFAARDTKPIYAIANNFCGSAALYLASQADKVYGTRSSQLGSIGVFNVHEDQSEADKKAGIKYTIVSAAPFKTEGNPHEPLSQEGEAYRQEIVNEIYDEFLTAVARGRDISKEEVAANYGGGRMLRSNKALEVGMIDGLTEFPQLLDFMSGQPAQAMTISLNGVDHVAKLNSSGIYTLLLDGVELSVSDYEHSEPGTGEPPTPRQQDSPDKAIQSGSRRPDLTRGLPNEALEPGAPKAEGISTQGENVMDLEVLFKLFGVKTEEELTAAITAMHTEQAALRSAVDTASQEQDFAKTFPDVWQQMQADRSKLLANDADTFVSACSKFTRMEGDKVVPTQIGMSALALDSVREGYMNAAKGEMTLDAFTTVVKAIVGGTVEYGEKGTSLEGDKPDYDTNSATGIAALRQDFAGKVATIQKEDKLEYAAAVEEAAKRYPDLAEAYNATASVR